jgi:hypothetical protein
VRRGTVSGDDRESAILALVGDYTADLDFRPERVGIVASKEGLVPAAGAYALGRPSAWRDPSSAVVVLRKALALAPDLNSIYGWVQAAARGLATASVPGKAQENLERLVVFAFTEPRITGPHVAAVMAGIRAGVAGFALADPAGGAMRALHRTFLAKQDEARAAQGLLAFVVAMDDSDRLTAVNILLERR